MGVFRQFPYSNFHEMNMDEIIKIIKNMLEEWATYHAEWDSWMDQMEDDWSNYQEVMNEAWQNMQDFINTYFDNLDLQEEVNNKIVSMIQTGEFGLLVNEYIPPAVSAWLALHITEPTGVVIDTSLTVSGACADAKVTGEIRDNVDSILNIEWVTGKYINNSGLEIENANFECTDFIELSDILYNMEYKLCLSTSGNVVSFYNHNQTYISGVAGVDNNIQKIGELTYPISDNIDNNAKYIRFSHCIRSAGITNPDPVVILKDIATKSIIANNSISTANLENQAVTQDKCGFIVHDPESNYIDKTKYSNGYINALGAFISDEDWRATDYCEIEALTQYYSGGLFEGYCAFYDADKTLISGYGAYDFTTSSFVTPADTAYGRFSIKTERDDPAKAWLFTRNEQPKDYGYILDGIFVNTAEEESRCEYQGDEISVFNKILCVGDSLTEGTFNHRDSGVTQYVTYTKYAYPEYLHKITGVDVTNLGHGGQTSVEWYETEENSDLSGYDCAIIQLGINDCGTYETLGNETKTAFANIISKLKTENENIKIFVANIIPASSYSSSDYITFSADLLTWLETAYATDPNVIPLDMQQYGNTGRSPAYNCGHLSALGYNRLAQDYKSYISWYISQNKMLFSEVQFIGTNYWYNNPNE